MAFEHYVQSGGKRLRCGFTTGTCAALAAAGAARLLLTGKAPETVSLVTPKGISVEVPLEQCAWTESRAVCAVRKDAGDDIDVTDGLLIFAAVEFSREPGIAIDGGEGVGRVTKPGLDQPVGAAAINHVPRQMIRAALEDVCGALCCQRGLRVTISVPGGAEIAAKTFNPNLGIVGGISILGTSGIVEPMSMQAPVSYTHLEDMSRYLVYSIDDSGEQQEGDLISFSILNLIENGDTAEHSYGLFNVTLERINRATATAERISGTSNGLVDYTTVTITPMSLSLEGQYDGAADENGIAAVDRAFENPEVTLTFQNGDSYTILDEDWRPHSTDFGEYGVVTGSGRGDGTETSGTVYKTYLFSQLVSLEELDTITIDGVVYQVHCEIG